MDDLRYEAPPPAQYGRRHTVPSREAGRPRREPSRPNWGAGYAMADARPGWWVRVATYGRERQVTARKGYRATVRLVGANEYAIYIQRV